MTIELYLRFGFKSQAEPQLLLVLGHGEQDK